MSSQFPPSGYDPTQQGQGSGYPPPPPGYAPPPPYGYGMPPVYVAPQPQTSGLAIASMVCGIIGLCSGIAGIAAVICGHLALSQIKRSNETIQGRGMAIAGLVMGYIGIALMVVLIVIYIVFFAIFATQLQHYPYPYLTPTPYGASPSGTLTCTQPMTRHWDRAPAMTIDPKKQYTATVHTTKGDIVVALDAKNSPIAVNNFVFLAEHNYYCGTYFWRVEQPGQPSPLDGQPSQLSLIQGGSVAKDGADSGDTPGYTIKDEPVVSDYTEGSVAMAKTSVPDSAGAQFFIDTADESRFFAKTYQIFGHVTSGMDVAKQITAGAVMEGVTITER